MIEAEGVKTNLGEVAAGFANVEEEIAQMSDLIGGVGVAIEIAESVDGEGEEDEAEHLSHSLPHALIKKTDVTGVSHQ